MNLLVVDDNEEIRNMLLLALSFKGHDVRTAGNGREALDLIGISPPDLVLTDLVMPIMDGLTLLGRLRSAPHYAHLPVVVITATATFAESATRDDPLVRVLGKPIHLAQLWAILGAFPVIHVASPTA